MNPTEQRIFLARSEVGRFDQDAFDGSAVLALPRDDLARPECEVLDLIGHRSQLARREILQRRNVDLVERGRRRGGERDLLAVFGERETACHQIIRRGYAIYPAGLRIYAE